VNLYFLFLIIALILTVLSKVFQFVFHSKIGDFIVIPAAISFVLAVLFSINKFNILFETDRHDAIIIALWACLAIVMLQLALMLLIGYHNKWGFGFIALFIICLGIFLFKMAGMLK